MSRAMFRQLAPVLARADCLWRTVDKASCHDIRRRFSEAVEDDVQKLKCQLLTAALQEVKNEGWSPAAVQAAAQRLDLSPAVVGLLDRPEGELVEYYLHSSYSKLTTVVSDCNLSLQGLIIEERLCQMLKWRLEMIIPYIDSWPQALAIMSRPTNLPHALQHLSRLIDFICVNAGGRTADYSWYTYRAAVGAIYTSSELYMLTDFSPGYSDTWEAVSRRVHGLHSTAQKVKHPGYASAEGSVLAAGLVQALLRSAIDMHQQAHSRTN